MREGEKELVGQHIASCPLTQQWNQRTSLSGGSRRTQPTYLQYFKGFSAHSALFLVPSSPQFRNCGSCQAGCCNIRQLRSHVVDRNMGITMFRTSFTDLQFLFTVLLIVPFNRRHRKITEFINMISYFLLNLLFRDWNEISRLIQFKKDSM